jgi:hypothetical protein
MSASTKAMRWLETTLKADTSLMSYVSDIFRDIAPATAQEPLVIIQLMASNDAGPANWQRTHTSCLFLIKVIGLYTDYANVEAAYNRIDALLAKVGAVAIPGGQMLGCYREEEIAYSEESDSQLWSHLGGNYRILVQ